MKLLAPYAPHIAEELWERLGNDQSVANALWPEYDEALTVDAEIVIVVQINGKVRSQFKAERGLDKTELERLAHGADRIEAHLESKKIVKTIVVPDKLVNIVVT